MLDTLLKRYGDMSFIMSLSAEEGLSLYKKATEKSFEEKAWERWLVDYSKMTKENFKSFAQYLKEIKQPPRSVDNRSDEEIINDAEEILKSMKRSG
jgi:heme oxygenase